MTKLIFSKVEFIKSAVEPKDYPCLKRADGKKMPEVAVIGRSNVGKSSLLNHLFRRKGMAKTSATPGKTQILNFFNVDDQVLFVDLPGYGYAKVPVTSKKKWGEMIEAYFLERLSSITILYLFDIRREPKEEDTQLIRWFLNRNFPVILVLTKVDKVKRSFCLNQTSLILNKLALPEQKVIHYSTIQNIGRQELITSLQQYLKVES